VAAVPDLQTPQVLIKQEVVTAEKVLLSFVTQTHMQQQQVQPGHQQ
jgi:hypothetical protein